MGFFTEIVVNYDPHDVISNRRKALKINNFEHATFTQMAEKSYK